MSSRAATPAVARPARRAGAVQRVALLGFGVAIGVLAVEGGLRLMGVVTDFHRSFWDPVLGARPLPDQTGLYIRGTYIRSHYRFNRQGWNSPRDYSIERTPGVARVCVIGDSMVEAMQVDPNASMTLVGERAMNKAGRKAEWYSFGCSGLGIAQYYLLLHHHVSYYRPDAVVVVLTSNDVYDSSPYLVSVNTRMNTLDVDEQGGLHLLPAKRFATTWREDAVRLSIIGRLLFTQFGINKPAAAGTRELRHKIYLRDEQRGQLLRGEKLSLDERAARSWLHVESVLGLIRDECRRLDARLLFVYAQNNPLLQAAYENRPHQPAPREEDPYCMSDRVWEMGQDWFEPISRRLAVEYLDLTAPLEAEVRATRQRHDFSPNDHHYNEMGNRVAGEALAVAVERLLAREPG